MSTETEVSDNVSVVKWDITDPIKVISGASTPVGIVISGYTR